MKNKKLLNNSEIASFCGQTAMILNAGITPAEGMDILLQDTKDAQGQEILSRILQICRQGESFCAAITAVGVFPDYVLHMVTLGEESGNLDEVMKSLSDYYEREEAIAENIRSSIRYPFIMIGMMLLVIFVLLTKVLPIFNQVFIQLGSEMTGFPSSLLSLGRSLNQYSIILLGVLVFFVLLYLLTSKTQAGKRMTNRFLCRFPLTRSFYEKMASGRFASGMAMALGSGLDTFGSLDLVSAIVDNKVLQGKIEACKKHIRDGDNLSESLIKSAIFSNLYSRMVAVGFRTGSIDLVMSKIAENYEKETDKTLRSIISVLEPTLVIILSLIVGLILLSVILPLMGIMSSIG